MHVPSRVWEMVIREIKNAEDHFRHSTRLFEKLVTISSVPAQSTDDVNAVYETKMAFQHAMLAGYSSVESALKRILIAAGEELPVGQSSHADLLDAAFEEYGGRPAVFHGTDIYEALTLLKNFRHISMHSYDNFSVNLAKPSAAAANDMQDKLQRQILEFIEKFDPQASPPHFPPCFATSHSPHESGRSR